VAGGKRETIPADLLLLHQGVVPNRQSGDGGWNRASLGRSATVLVAGARRERQFVGRRHYDRRRWRWHRRRQCGCGARTHRGTRGSGGTGACGWREASVDAALRADLTKAERGRVFLDTLFRPSPQFRIPSGNTIVCRCEEVTAKDVLDAVAIGATGPNQLKAYRRTGMGPCQGRLCGLTVTELMAQARSKTPQEIGYYRLRAPVKPITSPSSLPCRRARTYQGGGARMTKNVDADCRRRRHPRMLDGAASVSRRPEAGADREGLCGRHASGVNAGGVRQLARHIPEIPLSIRSMGSGRRSTISSTTIAVLKATARFWSRKTKKNSPSAARASPN